MNLENLDKLEKELRPKLANVIDWTNIDEIFTLATTTLQLVCENLPAPPESIDDIDFSQDVSGIALHLGVHAAIHSINEVLGAIQRLRHLRNLPDDIGITVINVNLN